MTSPAFYDPNFDPLSSMPSQIDQYEIVEKLGAGGMGTVFKAKDSTLRRWVAIKMVPRASKNDTVLKRFLREIDVCSRLDHPNIVKIYQVGTLERMPYLVMEYIAGETLLRHFEARATSLQEKIGMIGKIARALHYAHGRQVLHRDIKPSNIMVRENGEPVLMDFGLAKTSEVTDRSLTQSGEVIGTPQYMSPEQARGLKRQIDERSDVYGLGALLYHVLSGTPPADGESFMAVLRQVVEKSPVLPSRIHKEVPKALESICLVAISKNKKNRYASAMQMAQDIQAYLEGRTPRAERKWRTIKIVRSLPKIALGLGALILALWACRGFARVLEERSARSASRQWPPDLSPVQKSPLEIAEEYAKRAQEYANSKNYEEALESISRAIDLAPSPRHYLSKGKWLYESGHPKEAYSFLKTATEQDKGSLEAARYLAAAAEAVQRYPEAYRIYEQLHERHPEDTFRVAMGRISFKQNEPRAITHLEKAISSQGIKGYLLSEALYYRGLLHEEGKSFSDALDCYQKALAASPSELAADIHHRTGMIHYQNEEIAKALEHLQVACRSIAKDPELFNIAGKCHVSLKQFAQAISYFSHCIALAPWNYEYHYNRGISHHHIRAFREAENDFSSCLHLDPTAFDAFVRIMDNVFEEGFIENFSKIYMVFSILREQSFKPLRYDLFEREKKALDSLLVFPPMDRENPWDERKFELFFKNYTGRQSSSIQKLAEIGLLSLKNDVLYGRMKKVRLLFPESSRENIDTLLHGLVEKHLARHRHYLVRFYGYRDLEALREMYHGEELSRDVLVHLLKDRRENVIVRFFAAAALADLETKESDEALLEQSKSEESVARSLANLAATHKGMLDSSQAFEKIGEISEEFVRAMAAEHIPTRLGNAMEALLGDEKERVRLYAARHLYRQGNRKARKILQEGMTHADPLVRAFSIFVYWDFDSLTDPKIKERQKKEASSHLSLLSESTKDASPEVARIAMIRLGEWGDKRYNPIIAKCMESQKHPLVRIQTLIVLAKKERFELVIPVILDSKESFAVRSIALTALYNKMQSIPLPQLLPIFSSWSNDPDKKIRLLMLSNLGTVKHPICEQWLVKRLSDPDEYTRMGCVLGLWNTHKIEFLPYLDGLLKDPSPNVQGYAAAAYASLFLRHDHRNLSRVHEKFASQSPKIKAGASVGMCDVIYSRTDMLKNMPSILRGIKSKGSIFAVEQETSYRWDRIYPSFVQNMLRHLMEIPLTHPPKEDWKKAKSLDEYIALYESLLSLYPHRANAWFEHGLLWYVAGERIPDRKEEAYPKSMKSMEKACEMQNDSYLFRKWKAKLWALTGQHEQAQKLFDDLLREFPWEIEIWENYCELLRAEGKDDSFHRERVKWLKR